MFDSYMRNDFPDLSRIWEQMRESDNPHPINKQIKCISQNFGSYTILLVAASGGADWWYVVVTPRRVF